MSIHTKALIWAGLIIAFAFVAKSQGLSDGAAIGMISGLSGAAIGSLGSKSGCAKVCAQ